MKYGNIISKMTLAEKVALSSGLNFWRTRPFEEHGIPQIMVTDGPHGLRKQSETGDHLGINESVLSTCFPPACATASSWNPDLLVEMGKAIGEEAQEEHVAVVLGPGANIKRNPLCGRNFEYFSEDPFLAGEMAKSWILGVQGESVGVSLKHFAANSQENMRLASDSILDERALREIYLPAFEAAVKGAKPTTLMCAYNKINGTYCSDNKRLLTDILRGEWGHEGVVVTDWGAMHDRVEAFKAGLELEMPSSNQYFDADVIAAVESGALSEDVIDECVDRLLDLIFTATANQKDGFTYDREAHHQLARKVAADSAVLMKNADQILPLAKESKIALIGALAATPRYQGSGSSHINPTQLNSAVDGFNAYELKFDYFAGYEMDAPPNEALIAEAAAGAKQADVVVIFAGLTDSYESEGFDRQTMAMPESHNQLIHAVTAVNPNTVVVLSGGSPVEMPWVDEVKAILNLYLPGQAGGLAAADLLTGAVNPSGKLAETYPVSYEDVPSAHIYLNGGKQAQYQESIFVGYRYYDTANMGVRFPFGFGLSYTTFEYSDLKLSADEIQAGDELKVSLTVKNTGKAAGAEVVQVYVSDQQHDVFRPEKELKGFAKVYLAPGESKQVEISLGLRAFAYYHPEAQDWAVQSGEFVIAAGSSSRDLRLSQPVKVSGTSHTAPSAKGSDWYFNPVGKPAQADLESLLGHEIEPVRKPVKGEYDATCTLKDLAHIEAIQQVIAQMEDGMGEFAGGKDYNNPTFKMMMEMMTTTPLKNLSQLNAEWMTAEQVRQLVDLANNS
ncbi:MAG: glycoside hydrolase family 3 C-terminal domain-containing protein [Anaerolineaceae bacterium]|nr:glycoside hydrolase family 3 C-terminal domain-containing protein [Anaerolineaceae bacterium]